MRRLLGVTVVAVLGVACFDKPAVFTVHMGAIAKRIAKGGTYASRTASEFNRHEGARRLADSTVRRWLLQYTVLGVSAPVVFTLEKGRGGYVRYFGIGEAGTTALGANRESASVLIVWAQGVQAYAEIGESYTLGVYPEGVFPEALLDPES